MTTHLLTYTQSTSCHTGQHNEYRSAGHV